MWWSCTSNIRHAETPYDSFLARGMDRWEARAQVEGRVARVLAEWKGAERS
jgi:hypothetical protein